MKSWVGIVEQVGEQRNKVMYKVLIWRNARKRHIEGQRDVYCTLYCVLFIGGCGFDSSGLG